MQQNQKFDDVVAKALDFIREKLKLKYSSCRHYQIGWSLIKTFLDSRQTDLIDPGVCQDFISELVALQETRELLPKEKRAIKAALVLSEFMRTDCIQRRDQFKYLDGQAGDLIQAYILFKQPMRLSKTTIRQIEKNLSEFNFWLASAGIHSICDLKQCDVIRFIQGLDPGKPGYVHVMLGHLKAFFKYLFNHDLIPYNIAASVPRDNYGNLAKLPSYYSEDEINQVLAHLDRGTGLGKRDYAIFMLGVRLGMRASDIANIGFGNLHWDTNIIVFQQHKGGAELTLPLLPAVGNAILDYLQYGRPKSDESALFLIQRAPYIPVSAATVGAIVSRRLRNAHINLKNRKQGSHVLRHSLVKQLLDNGRTLPVITEVLGHQSQESTRHYIRIDVESLRKCALDVPPVNPQFYCQDQHNYFYL